MPNKTSDRNGQLEPAGDRWRLRFTRHLPHTPEKVWRALTEPEQLRAWFPQRIVGPWTVGGPLRFESDYGDFDGEVLAFQQPTLIEFRWGTDTIRLELAPDAPDGSVLTLLDMFAELGKAARDAAGWHVCLDRLESELSGVATDGAPGENWQAAHARYRAHFSPEAQTIGPPDMPAQRTHHQKA